MIKSLIDRKVKGMVMNPSLEDKDETVETTSFPKVLTFREKLGYAAGDLGNGFLFEMGQLYLLKYMTDVLGLPAVSAGGVFLVAKIWDAFADIGVGTIIDHRKKIGPRGRFRPFMLWAALPLGLLLIANFTVPDFTLKMQEVWCYITYILFGTVYSVSNIAYGSMQPTMTKNNIERSQLASWRTVGSNIGTLVSTVAFMPIVLLMPSPHMGYSTAAIIFAIGGIACQLFCYSRIKERYEDEKQRQKDFAEQSKEGTSEFKEIIKSYGSVFKNGPLLILCLANLFSFSAFNVKQAVQFYFAQYALHNITIISYMAFFTMGSATLAAVCIPWLTKTIGKKSTFIIGCVIWAISDGIGYFVTGDAVVYTIITTISYFGYGLTSGLNWALISDVVEFGEWKTHVRSEGIVYSSYTYFRKLSQAAAGLVPGIVLSAVGYVPNHVQTAQAIAGIRGLVFIYPVVMAVLTTILMLFYPLTEDKYTEIMNDLERRHIED